MSKFFKAEKCVKCKNKKCKKPVYLNVCFEKSHKFSDVDCPRYTTKL